LFDAHAFARGLESAYTKMAERARAGGAPALIRVLLPAASGLNS
jgi:hypothetical protein